MHFMGSGGFVRDAALIDQPLTGSPLNFFPSSLKAELQATRLRHSTANIAVTISGDHDARFLGLCLFGMI